MSSSIFPLIKCIPRCGSSVFPLALQQCTALCGCLGIGCREKQSCLVLAEITFAV